MFAILTHYSHHTDDTDDTGQGIVWEDKLKEWKKAGQWQCDATTSNTPLITPPQP